MKKLGTRFLALLCTLTLVFSLTACGGGKNGSALDPKNPVTITLWHYYEGDLRIVLDELVEQFNVTVGIESGVNINPRPMGTISDLESNITDSAKGVINSEPLPDIFFSYADKAMEIDSLIELVDLSTIFTKEQLDAYVPAFLEDGYVDGRLLVLPIVKSTELVYINATAWNEFSADTGYTESAFATWEALYEASKAYKEWSDGPALFGIDTLANFLIVGMKQLGVDVLENTGGTSGRVVVDESGLRRLFDVYYNASVLGYFGAVSRFRSDDVKSGDLVSYTGSSSGASYFPTAVGSQDIDFLALSFPVFEGGDPTTIQQGAGVCVIESDAAHTEGAALFLDWFTGIEPNTTISLRTGYLPVTEAAYTSQELADGLEELLAGSKADNNTAAVYAAASTQVLNGDAYAATPFDGSYTARGQLQYTLADIVEEDVEAAAALFAQGLSDEEVLSTLGPDGRFADWMADLKAGLDRQGIDYIVQ